MVRIRLIDEKGGFSMERVGKTADTYQVIINYSKRVEKAINSILYLGFFCINWSP